MDADSRMNKFQPLAIVCTIPFNVRYSSKKKYFKSCTYYDIATPKREKKLEKQHTAIINVCVYVLISFADLVNIFFPIVNTEPKQNAKHFYILYARDFASLNGYMDEVFFLCVLCVSFFLCSTDTEYASIAFQMMLMLMIVLVL